MFLIGSHQPKHPALKIQSKSTSR